MTHQRGDFRRRPVQFHQEQRAAIRIIRVHRRLRRLNRQIVHHLDRRRQHARTNHVAYCRARFIRGRKRGQQRAHAFRPLHDAQNYFRGNPQRSFRSDKNSHQIVSRRIQSFSAQMHQRAVREHHFQSQDMRGGESIFQAVRASRIFRHVSADAANRLRGRIRRIKIFLRRDAAGHIQINHAGFHRHARVRKIHLQNLVHARQANHDSVFHRQRAPAQSRPGAARDKWKFFAVTHADNFLHLFGGIWQQHRARQHAKICQPVALIGVEFFARSDQAARSDNFAQLLENPAFHGARPRREACPISA